MCKKIQYKIQHQHITTKYKFYSEYIKCNIKVPGTLISAQNVQ